MKDNKFKKMCNDVSNLNSTAEGLRERGRGSFLTEVEEVVEVDLDEELVELVLSPPPPAVLVTEFPTTATYA